MYLAAPDTDFGPFINRYMKFIDIVERTRININQNDKVLRHDAMSNGISRLGRPNREELSEEEGRALIEAQQKVRSKYSTLGAPQLSTSVELITPGTGTHGWQ